VAIGIRYIKYCTVADSWNWKGSVKVKSFTLSFTA
jgi:hypothetical protein